MKIWIDLANTPHVNFFLPIINYLSTKQDKETLITLRDFSQTLSLAKKEGIEGVEIGQHGGRSRLGKLLNLMNRSIKLLNFSKNKNIDIVVSHNSYTHIIAGKLGKIKTVTLMDYEGQPANHLAFRLADKIIVPEYFPDSDLKKFGANFSKVYKYKGFKEQVYLSDFVPNKTFCKELIQACDLDKKWDISKTTIVTTRTPATMAAYHRFQNPLFDKLLDRLNRNTDLTVIALPRTKEQEKDIKRQYPNLKFLKYPVDGKQLVYHSDLVISAGGTMNREAAILGTPAYTIFAGKIPAVDRTLIDMGKMFLLSNTKDLDKLQYIKQQDKQILTNKKLCEELINEILTV